MSDQELKVILEGAPKLKQAYGRLLGAFLVWKALSILKPRNALLGTLFALCSAAGAVWWHK